MQITAAVEGKLHQYLWHEYQWWMCLPRINKSLQAGPKWSILKFSHWQLLFAQQYMPCAAVWKSLLMKRRRYKVHNHALAPNGTLPQSVGDSHPRLLTCDISASSSLGCSISPSLLHIPRIHHFLEWHFHVRQERQTRAAYRAHTRITSGEGSLVHHYRPQRPYLNVPVSCQVITPRV